MEGTQQEFRDGCEVLNYQSLFHRKFKNVVDIIPFLWNRDRGGFLGKSSPTQREALVREISWHDNGVADIYRRYSRSF